MKIIFEFNQYRIFSCALKRYFFKSNEILVPTKYYRLRGVFKLVKCSDKIVNNTFKIYDQMLDRTESSIPKILWVIGE